MTVTYILTPLENIYMIVYFKKCITKLELYITKLELTTVFKKIVESCVQSVKHFKIISTFSC